MAVASGDQVVPHSARPADPMRSDGAAASTTNAPLAVVVYETTAVGRPGGLEVLTLS
jgi:hypothetical protein